MSAFHAANNIEQIRLEHECADLQDDKSVYDKCHMIWTIRGWKIMEVVCKKWTETANGIYEAPFGVTYIFKNALSPFFCFGVKI